MYRWLITLALILTLGSFLPTSSMAGAPFISPSLANALSNSPADSTVSVVVFLENESAQNSVGVISRNETLSRAERIHQVTSRLKSAHTTNAAAIDAFLRRNATDSVKKHWIVPAYSATLPLSAVNELSRMDGVKEIVVNARIELIEPVDVRAATTSSASVATPLVQLNVPALWRLGLTGKGSLICSFDTGVDEPHPALAPKWRGNHAPLRACWYSALNNDTIPFDKSGHGSHTMGIMVGSLSTDSFGVAPGAEWISAGVIDQGHSLAVTVSDILGAFEWALDPDGDSSTTDDVPDVILNSWGIPKGVFAVCDETFYQAIDNVEAAGIVTIFAAGNEGPNAMTIRNPGDRATTPINSLAVGAVDATNTVASFSSRGPSSCDTTQIKPEVVAPGVSIRSCAKGGGYAIMSGTSMAAPFIAGLAALCRQYNPDATVEQIKNAIISAATDLGPAGDDNAYGHGLVDAAKLLTYLPAPSTSQFMVSDVVFDGPGYAAPGATTDCHLVLRNMSNNSGLISGRLQTADPTKVTVEQDLSTFSFSGDMSTSDQAYRLTFASDLPHGQKEPFTLTLAGLDGSVIQTATVTITVGVAPNGGMALHNAGDIEFTISDFGQYGFAAGSIYNLGGQGFRYNGGANLLYESGLMVSSNSTIESNAVRDSLGELRRSDFTPVSAFDASVDQSMAGVHHTARFTDEKSTVLHGLVISQQSVDYASAADQGIIMIQYYLINTSQNVMSDVSFGFMADFDLSPEGDSVGYDQPSNLFYQTGDQTPFVGIVGLQNVASFKTITNGATKVGLSRTTLAEMIASPVSSVASAQRADMGVLVSTGPITLLAGDSVAVTLALVAADNASDLFGRADRARTIFTTSGVSDLPDDYYLSQNYPNPFNPQTTIQFSLPNAGDIQLDVYNLLGRLVATISDGYHAAGTYTVQWDGRDSRGNDVASGVYFYRLMAPGVTASRKMVLLH